MGEADGKPAGRQTGLAGHQFAIHGKPAFTVQFFAGFEVAFGRGHRVTPEAGRGTCRFMTQRHAGHRDAQFQTYQMKWLPEGRVAARRNLSADHIRQKQART